MINLQSYVIYKLAVCNLDVRIQNVHQIRRRCVVNEPRIVKYGVFLNIVLCINRRSIVTPIILEGTIMALNKGIALYKDGTSLKSFISYK